MALNHIFNNFIYKTVYDIEQEHHIYLSDKFKTTDASKYLLEIFNYKLHIDGVKPDNLTISYGFLLEMIGLYYNIVLKNSNTATMFFEKAIELGETPYITMSIYEKNPNKQQENLLKAYNIESSHSDACAFLGLFYGMTNNNELMFYYLNKGIELKNKVAMNIMANYYYKKNDYINAIIYLELALQHNYYPAYFGMYKIAKKIKDNKMVKKYRFYTLLYTPVLLLHYYKKRYIDTPETDNKLKEEFFRKYNTQSLDDYQRFKQHHNNTLNNIFQTILTFKNIMYFPNSTLLVAELIPKRKLFELANTYSETEFLNENVYLTNGFVFSLKMSKLE